MEALAVVIVGIVAILGLIQIVHDRIRESRQLDDLAGDGTEEAEIEPAEDSLSPR